MAGGEQRNERHESAIRRARIVELRDAGLTFREIAAEVGLAYQTVWDHYQKAMRDIPAAAVAAHRELIARRRDEQLRRIDMEREAVMEVLAARHVTVSNGQIIREDGQPILDDAPVLVAVDRLVKLDDQEAKLLGLYAPTKSRVEVVDDTVARMLVEQLEAELAELQPEDGSETPEV